ncbi:MAG: hypothetical protein KAY65_07530 [Planctomycetes bacterium]|nr:hypothetical protein [Planctomycetota bacterium]
MRVVNKEFSKNVFCAGLPRINPAGMACGSALILTVVLTSLLAIVGVLFLMAARVDRMATSAVSQSLELDLAVDTVVAKISGQLIWDVPGTKIPGRIPPAPQYPEYHDYPGLEDPWLANLEPYDAGPAGYIWQQISDVTGYLRFVGWTTHGVPIVKVLDDSPIDLAGSPDGQLADADGDGVADSKWIVIDGITSSKGEPVYAAIRVIDNGGMINVNAAFVFDPCDPRPAYIDGSSQMQINLMALANRPGILPSPADVNALLLTRANYGVGLDPYNLTLYENAVIWQYGELTMPYTPFDISDELELRNRFLLNQRDIFARIEELGWTGSFTNIWTLKVPIGQGGSSSTVDDWFARANISIDPDIYDYRHIATTCSMDRVITPDGFKMVAVTASPQKIFEALASGIDPNFLPGIDANDLAAQLAVNIKDFSDPDLWVTYFRDPRGKMYYGFEPQPFISEIAFKISGTDPTDLANNHFAVELYNPFDVDISLSGFTLELRRGGTVVNTVNLAGTIAADSRRVITNGPAASTDFGITGLLDTKLVLAKYTQKTFLPEYPDYEPEKYDIYLIRTVGGSQIYLDRQDTEDAWFDWDVIKDTGQFYSRPDNDWNILYQNMVSAGNTLDNENAPVGAQKNYNIPSFAAGLVTLGDIARVLTVGPSTDPNNTVGAQIAAEPNEWSIRIDLQNPAFANIFQYLTVIDPAAHGRPAGETRIKGRININTAPPFVIAQLPWMVPGAVGPAIVEAVVAYRDKAALPGGPDYRARLGPAGLRSVGELAQVWAPGFPGMDFYACDGVDQTGFPDLTPSDGAVDDFEERDLIFSRLSDLTTVRSDVFTAYILVRIGADGPQKRVIAILDRSEVKSTDKYPKVKIRALHPVPDPW